MFSKVLVANRGEIACRVMATCRRLGIATVAVYSDADANARHVALADEAVHIGPSAARDSYLVIDKIIAAARRTGAQAIHPGYGFLSERAEFADACATAGITFIGPSPSAIRAMGLKGAAKALMVQAGVPVVPGYHGDDQSPDFLAAEAARIGWPVLIKAVAGGGGKGMRRVDAAADFAAALAGAQREAKAAFGDDKVLLEKYLLKPRHIEVQVFGDSHGNAVHLFERDCSVQRRHQKVLEEAPAPGMTDEMRAAMGKAAVAAAKAINYSGAGTIEFIADVSAGLRADRFYFMEMNTRLQVEHPVTEAITGQDLVEWQMLVAAGGTLPLRQEQLRINGHAVEVRIYAEDPDRDFLPSTGTLHRLRAPAEGNGVRVDTGVREGDTVTPYYDPMIAKLIAHGASRQAALAKLHTALGGYEIAGLAPNIDFLGRLVTHPAFAAGDLDTGFIDRHRGDLLPVRRPADDKTLALAALHLLLARREAASRAALASPEPDSPWHQPSGWQPNLPARDTLALQDGDTVIVIEAGVSANGWTLGLPRGSVAAMASRAADGGLLARLDGHAVRAAVVQYGDTIAVLRPGVTHRLKLPDPLAGYENDEGIAGAVATPMPGRIIQVMARAGDAVHRGQPILVLEAMKMEHTIVAPGDGTLETLGVEVGQQVNDGQTLFAIKADASV